MTYFIYEIATGKILSRNTNFNMADVGLAMPEGSEYYLNADLYPGATHIIDNEPVTIATVYPIPPLLIYQEAQCRLINKARDAAELETFSYLGKEFDADPLAIKRITLAVQAAQICLMTTQPFAVTWTCADNSTIELDGSQMVGILAPMIAKGESIHTKATSLKVQVMAATTRGEVEAVTW